MFNVPVSSRLRHLTGALLIGLGSLGAAHAQNVALLLFGGQGHKTFLGCLNCGKYDSGSVCNKYGEFGSKYSTTSIWNKYGEYGSKYSNLSPWNKYASEPPVIVDREGGFYGYLTANQYHAQRTRIRGLLMLTNLAEAVNEDADAVADNFCGRD